MYRRFEIGECIGRGGFGEIYRAHLVIRGKPALPVALKVLHEGLDPASQAVQRLRDESRMLRALAHPNILKAFDLVVLEDRVALVTELVEGADLSRVVRRGALPCAAALEVAEALSSALHAARSTRIDGRPISLIHRDVKPGNVLLSRDGTVRLLDFGMARTDELAREAHTATDVVMGSLTYMAPEVLASSDASHASDVYALGLTLYETVTGHRLFAMRGPALFRVLLDPELFEEERQRSLARVVDADLAHLLESMSRHDAGERPDVKAVRDRIRGLRCQQSSGLAAYLEQHPLPAIPLRSGSLSGRVIDVDGRGVHIVDADQATVIVARPTAPAAPTRRVPPPTTQRVEPSHTLLFAVAVPAIAFLMVVAFIGTYLLGTLSLRW